MEIKRGRKGNDPIEYFWAHVDKRGPDECWPWTGSTNRAGYGVFMARQKRYKAHRVALEIELGAPLASDDVVRHFVCDNPCCCNPAHLRVGTISDNIMDAFAKDRYPKIRGEQHHGAKFTEDQVRDIVRFYYRGLARLVELARAYRASRAVIYSITHGRTWTHITQPLLKIYNPKVVNSKRRAAWTEKESRAWLEQFNLPEYAMPAHLRQEAQ